MQSPQCCGTVRPEEVTGGGDLLTICKGVQTEGKILLNTAQGNVCASPAEQTLGRLHHRRPRVPCVL